MVATAKAESIQKTMFTYLKPDIRERLIADKKLVRLNQEGEVLEPQQPSDDRGVTINLMGPIPMPIALPGIKTTVKWYAAVRSTELAAVNDLADTLMAGGSPHLFADLVSPLAVNSVLVVGEPSNNPLIRVHSNCLTGDIFGSMRCDCGPQLAGALQKIENDPAGGGYLVYMAGHEGRGIGLWAKAATYLLQDSGEDTYQANRSLGLPDDCRDFTDAAVLIKYFVAGEPFRLLTNNPKKVEDLTAAGLVNITQEKHVAGVSHWNRDYLTAKIGWGHAIDEADF